MVNKKYSLRGKKVAFSPFFMYSDIAKAILFTTMVKQHDRIHSTVNPNISGH